MAKVLPPGQTPRAVAHSKWVTRSWGEEIRWGAGCPCHGASVEQRPQVGELGFKSSAVDPGEGLWQAVPTGSMGAWVSGSVELYPACSPGFAGICTQKKLPHHVSGSR